MAVLTSITLSFILIALVKCEIMKFNVLGEQGQSCHDTCISMQSTCDMTDYLTTKESEMQEAMEKLDVKCIYDNRLWWSFDQPSIVVSPFDSNFGRCVGWRGKPNYHDCSARHTNVRRLCRCERLIHCGRSIFSWD